MVPLNPDYLDHEFADSALVIGTGKRLETLRRVVSTLDPSVALIDAEDLPAKFLNPAQSVNAGCRSVAVVAVLDELRDEEVLACVKARPNGEPDSELAMILLGEHANGSPITSFKGGSSSWKKDSATGTPGDSPGADLP